MRLRRLAALVLLVVPLACGDDDSTPEAATTTVPVRTEPPVAFGEATEPVVVAHRGGADGEHPDNSLEAFAEAADRGAEWIELDVRLAPDGEVVLSHDPIGDAEGLPTLDEALDVIDEDLLGVDVEIKSIPTEEDYDPTLAVVPATLEVLDAHPIAGPIVVSSFDRAALDRVGDAYDTVFITQGIGGAEELAASLVDGGHDGLAIGDPALSRPTFRLFADAGLPVWMWTIDSPRTAQRLVRRGAAGIITDVPEAISAALR